MNSFESKYFSSQESYPKEPAIDILLWNHIWEYSGHYFLNTFIKYVNIERMYVLGRYRKWDEFIGQTYETKLEIFEKMKTNPDFHFELHNFKDDVLILASVPKNNIRYLRTVVHPEDSSYCGYPMGADGCQSLGKNENGFDCMKYFSDTGYLEVEGDRVKRCKACLNKHTESESRFVAPIGYYYFWFDCDVSDCVIGRFKTNNSKDQVIKDFDDSILEVNKEFGDEAKLFPHKNITNRGSISW